MTQPRVWSQKPNHRPPCPSIVSEALLSTEFPFFFVHTIKIRSFRADWLNWKRNAYPNCVAPVRNLRRFLNGKKAGRPTATPAHLSPLSHLFALSHVLLSLNRSSTLRSRATGAERSADQFLPRPFSPIRLMFHSTNTGEKLRFSSTLRVGTRKEAGNDTLRSAARAGGLCSL